MGSGCIWCVCWGRENSAGHIGSKPSSLYIFECLGLALYAENFFFRNDASARNQRASLVLDCSAFSERKRRHCAVGWSDNLSQPFRISFLGLQVIVITGDNKLTAEAICRKVGVFAVDEDLAGKSITGVEFMKLPLDKRRSMLAGNGGACFSRAEPKHKQVLLTPLALGSSRHATAALPPDYPEWACFLCHLTHLSELSGVAASDFQKEQVNPYLGQVRHGVHALAAVPAVTFKSSQ